MCSIISQQVTTSNSSRFNSLPDSIRISKSPVTSQVKRCSGILRHSARRCRFEKSLPSSPSAKHPSSRQLLTKPPPEQPISKTFSCSCLGYSLYSLSLNRPLVLLFCL